VGRASNQTTSRGRPALPAGTLNAINASGTQKPGHICRSSDEPSGTTNVIRPANPRCVEQRGRKATMSVAPHGEHGRYYFIRSCPPKLRHTPVCHLPIIPTVPHHRPPNSCYCLPPALLLLIVRIVRARTIRRLCLGNRRDDRSHERRPGDSVPSPRDRVGCDRDSVADLSPSRGLVGDCGTSSGAVRQSSGTYTGLPFADRTDGPAPPGARPVPLPASCSIAPHCADSSCTNDPQILPGEPLR
jgi:hypothetical protein